MFFHGTNSKLKEGDVIAPGNAPPSFNYDQAPKHVYFTTSLQAAQNYAEFRASHKGGSPVVYEVYPIGPARRDPEGVQGNYRATSVRVIREVPRGSQQ